MKNKIFIHFDDNQAKSYYEIFCKNKQDAYNIYKYIVNKHGIIKYNIGRTNELFINEEDLLKLFTKINIDYFTINYIPKIIKSNKIVSLIVLYNGTNLFGRKISIIISENKEIYKNYLLFLTYYENVIIELYDYIIQNYSKYNHRNDMITLSDSEYINFTNTINNLYQLY